MKLTPIAALGLAWLPISCAGDDSPAQSTAKANCGPIAAACGGAVAGSWQVADSCAAIAGTLDLLCTGATFRTAGMKVTMALDYRADGTYTARRSFTFTETITAQVPSSCLARAGGSCDGLVTLAKQAAGAGLVATCTPTSAGCDCSLNILSVKDADQAGTYSVVGGTVTNVYPGGSEAYDFCATGNQLQMSPNGGSVTVTLPNLGPGSFSGSIVLSK